LWYWGRFFTSQDEEEFNMVAEKEPGVRKAVATLMELSDDERNRMLADARDRWVSDQMALRKDSYRKGLAEGRENGRLEGLEEIARKMKQAGQPPEQITAFTGLSQEKINLL
jgi:predicted transposase/invertase (TIGR01784 family)